MAQLSEKNKEIRQLKSVALRRRLKEFPKTEPELAHETMQNSRVTIAQWKSGKSWPKKKAEQLLENALHLPLGFFDAIAEGESYENALSILHQTRQGSVEPSTQNDPNDEELLETLMRLMILFEHDNAAVRTHIINQIKLLSEAQFPEDKTDVDRLLHHAEIARKLREILTRRSSDS